MKLTFLGTRGNIETRTDRHGMHSSMKVSYYGQAVIIDCGEDWLGKIDGWGAQAIVVTHAHPDHAAGLKAGAPCPVYATKASWEDMENFDIKDRRPMPAGEPVQIAGITFEAFPVLHSTRAPAVGYRIVAGRVGIFYVPDVAWIKDRVAALSGVKLYIGDGATVARSMVRKPGDVIIGHVPIRTQLTWCQKFDIPQAIFTHLGSQIVEGDEEEYAAKIREFASERDVNDVAIAHDGMEVVVR